MRRFQNARANKNQSHVLLIYVLEKLLVQFIFLIGRWLVGMFPRQ